MLLINLLLIYNQIITQKVINNLNYTLISYDLKYLSVFKQMQYNTNT